MKQQRQLTATLLSPLPQFPTNSGRNPVPFPKRGRLRTSPRSGPCRSSGARRWAAGSASAAAAPFSSRPPGGLSDRPGCRGCTPSSSPHPLSLSLLSVPSPQTHTGAPTRPARACCFRLGCGNGTHASPGSHGPAARTLLPEVPGVSTAAVTAPAPLLPA